ncbi:hypothetical protein D3C74_435390 [compost metagenome]
MACPFLPGHQCFSVFVQLGYIIFRSHFAAAVGILNGTPVCHGDCHTALTAIVIPNTGLALVHVVLSHLKKTDQINHLGGLQHRRQAGLIDISD